MAKKEIKKTSKRPPKPDINSWINKYGPALLILLPLVMYIRTVLVHKVNGGIDLYTLTQLDDYIFIFDKAEFNKHFINIFSAFTRGVFNEKDIYYRPLFLVSFVLEYPLGLGLADAGNAGPTSLLVYHITNLLLHLGCVLVLFSFLKQIKIRPIAALLLTLIFALHPVLTMAVAWIPGRNDTMLTLFALLFFKSYLHYLDSKKIKYLLYQFLWLLLAFFTKETAVLLPLAAIGLYFVYIPSYSLSPQQASADNAKKSGSSPFEQLKMEAMWLLLSWVIIFTGWYLLRLQAVDNKYFSKSFSQLVSDSVSRLPAYIVYLGKIFLPVNLSVFPSLSNSPLVYGYIALGIVAGLIFFTKNKNYKMMIFGAFWFVLFILPFFFVPKEINDQVFEHRLYLPIIGILILLSQTFLFNGETKEKYAGWGCVALFIVFFIISNSYIKLFKEPLGFWKQAVESSPQSSYAQKLLGARYMDEMNDLNRVGLKDSAEIEHKKALKHFQLALKLNKEEKHARFFIARDILEPKQAYDSAEVLLRQEIAINPTYTEAYFELSHIFFMKERIDSSLKYLLISRGFQPKDNIINNNLLLTYIRLNDYKGAKNQVNYMNINGLTVDEKAINSVEAIPH